MLKLVTDTPEVIENIQNTKPNEVISYFQNMGPKLLDFGLTLLFAVIVLLIGIKVIGIIRKLVKRSLIRANVDTGVQQFMDSFTKAISYIILAAIIAGCFGFQMASVVALLGSVGLTIGLALQGSLSNFAGGVLILLLKPFKVGDYIIEDTRKNEGVVSEIKLFYTKLNTTDNRVVVIPNGTLANSSLTNFTAQDRRRLTISVGISYQADILKAKAILQQILNGEEAVLKEEDTHIYVDELADSCVRLGIICWVKTEEYMMTKWRMTENIKLEFDKALITIPYKQLEITMKETIKEAVKKSAQKKDEEV